jgi:hypothetical protein
MVKIVLRDNSKAGMIMLCMVTLSLGFFFCQNSALAQGCPPIRQVTDSFVGTEPTEPERLFRDGVASQCSIPPKSFPGTVSEQNIYKTYRYTNIGNLDACVTVKFDVGTCGEGFDVFASAYLDAFDPNQLALNYVGDLGSGITQPFQFNIPANRNFVLVTNSVYGPVSCTYSFEITGLPCQGPTIATPTLTNWGLIVSALLLIGSTAFFMSRRKDWKS